MYSATRRYLVRGGATCQDAVTGGEGIQDRFAFFAHLVCPFSCALWVVSGLIPKKLKNPSGFDESEFSAAFSASKYTNPTDEIRHSAHPRKVTNLLNNFRASIGPKSKTRIFKIRRENKLAYSVSTCRFNWFSAIPAYFFDEY